MEGSWLAVVGGWGWSPPFFLLSSSDNIFGRREENSMFKEETIRGGVCRDKYRIVGFPRPKVPWKEGRKEAKRWRICKNMEEFCFVD